MFQAFSIFERRSKDNATAINTTSMVHMTKELGFIAWNFIERKPTYNFRS